MHAFVSLHDARMNHKCFVLSRKQLKQMMEHATQFPGEYSKVAGVTAKVPKLWTRCITEWVII